MARIKQFATFAIVAVVIIGVIALFVTNVDPLPGTRNGRHGG